MTRILISLGVLAAASVSLPSIGRAGAVDDGPASRVRYTLAREHDLSREITLPGTVEAPRSSRVASEVEGAVSELLVREGQHVKKGAPLAKLRTEELTLSLERVRADLREAEARLALTRSQMDRAQKLFDDQVLSRQQLDDARFEYEALRGRVDRLEAEVATTELDIERSTIRAPFAGVVTREVVDVGEWVAKGATVVELMSPYVLEIRVDLPERHFSEISRGSNTRVHFESLDGYEVEGRVASLVPKANDASRTFPMKIRIENEGGRIGSGMLASVDVPVGANATKMIVPKDAVISRNGKRFVYTINADDTVSLVPVVTGAGVGEWVVVTGDVTPETKVVTRGNERIQPGQKVAGEALAYTAP